MLHRSGLHQICIASSEETVDYETDTIHGKYSYCHMKIKKSYIHFIIKTIFYKKRMFLHSFSIKNILCLFVVTKQL